MLDNTTVLTNSNTEISQDTIATKNFDLELPGVEDVRNGKVTLHNLMHYAYAKQTENNDSQLDVALRTLGNVYTRWQFDRLAHSQEYEQHAMTDAIAMAINAAWDKFISAHSPVNGQGDAHAVITHRVTAMQMLQKYYSTMISEIMSDDTTPDNQDTLLETIELTYKACESYMTTTYARSAPKVQQYILCYGWLVLNCTAQTTHAEKIAIHDDYCYSSEPDSLCSLYFYIAQSYYRALAEKDWIKTSPEVAQVMQRLMPTAACAFEYEKITAPAHYRPEIVSCQTVALCLLEDITSKASNICQSPQNDGAQQAPNTITTDCTTASASPPVVQKGSSDVVM